MLVKPRNPYNIWFVSGNVIMIQNQIHQGMGPQNHNLLTNQMLGMANLIDPMQNVDQGPPGFVSNRVEISCSNL